MDEKTTIKIFRKLYSLKNKSKRVRNLVDDLAMELIGESWIWPQDIKAMDAVKKNKWFLIVE